MYDDEDEDDYDYDELIDDEEEYEEYDKDSSSSSKHTTKTNNNFGSKKSKDYLGRAVKAGLKGLKQLITLLAKSKIGLIILGIVVIVIIIALIVKVIIKDNSDKVTGSVNSYMNSSSSSVSEEAKKLFEEKHSLLLVSIKDINAMYKSFMEDDEIRDEEVKNYMSTVVGENELTPNDASEGGVTGGTTPGTGETPNVPAGQLAAFSTGSPGPPLSYRGLTQSEWDMIDKYLEGTTELRRNIVKTALSGVGNTFYSQQRRAEKYNGTGNHADCSSFVAWAYNQGGKPMSVNIYTGVIAKWTVIDRSELKPGDVLLKDGSRGLHVKIFIGWTTEGSALCVDCTNPLGVIDPVNGTEIGNAFVDVTDANYLNNCRRYLGPDE